MPRRHHEIGEPREPLAVTAKTRKRCPFCARMIEKGEVAILTDDRHIVNNVSRNHGGHQYRASRGAYHLWHPQCREALAVRAAELETLRDEQNAELEALIASLKGAANV